MFMHRTKLNQYHFPLFQLCNMSYPLVIEPWHICVDTNDDDVDGPVGICTGDDGGPLDLQPEEGEDQ